MALYRDQGVVLRTYKLGEADRIVVLLTQGRGKVRAVAKGVRKTKSRFGGRLEPLSHVAAQFYEGRELDIVTQAETIDSFRTIRDDLERTGRAMTLLEVADQVAQEREADVRLYQMLVGALRALAARNSPALVAGFLWKLLSLEGSHPVLESCASCASSTEEVELVAFDLAEGGALCRTCRRGRPVTAEALELVRRILGGGLASALAEPPGPVVHEVEALAAASVEAHIERRLRSLHVLDR